MSEKRRIVSNTLANGMAQLVAMGTSLIFMPLLIRSFHATEFGLYLLASSIAAYANLVDFGVGTSLMKNVAEKSTTGDREGLGKYISTSLTFYIFAGLMVAAILCTIAMFTGSLFKVDADGARLLRNMLLVVGVTSLFTWPATTSGIVLGGLQQYTLTARTSILTTLGIVGVNIAVILTHEGPLVLLIGTSVIGILAGVANTVLARRAIRDVRVHPADADAGVFKDIVSFSWVIFVLQICTVIIYQQTDRVVLGVFLGGTAITLYESAGKMQGLVTQFTQFASSAVMPFATQLDAEERESSIHTLFFRGTKYVMALVLPMVTGLMVLAEPIITHWLGPAFTGQALAAQILLSYQLLWVGPVIGESILISRGHAYKRLFNGVFVVTLGNLVLSIVLVQHIGILGVVIGTALPWVIDYPWRMRTALNEVGVSFWDWLAKSAGPVYLSLAVSAVVAWACYFTPLVRSLPGLAVALVLSIAASWAGLLAFAMTPVEKAELRGVLRRMSGRLSS